MQTYTGMSGSKYILASVVGSGGEGTVYDISGRSDIVGKIYSDTIFKTDIDRQTMERKLKTMIGMNIRIKVDGILRLAWPLDILYKQGRMMGFVMPKIINKLNIYDIQRCWRPNFAFCSSTQETLKVYPRFTWKYSVQFAYNLAWVVNYVHCNRIVIGDLNLNNIYADTRTGAMVLIDCDSFDITDPNTGERFPCRVGVRELLAPELQGKKALAGGFTKHTDEFSLAIHIFRLLMRNADPFSGVGSKGASLPACDKGEPNIINGECPYVRQCNISVPSWAPDFSMLPLDIQNLFRKTFDYNALNYKSRISKRATAEEWVYALAPLGEGDPNPRLKNCTDTSSTFYEYHVYPEHNITCPWCKCEKSQSVIRSNPGNNSTTGNTSNGGNKSNTGNTSNGSNKSKISIALNTAKMKITNKIKSVFAKTNKKTVNTNTHIKRAPWLFYIVLIACGIASGFSFESLAYRELYSVLDWSSRSYVVILSIIGAMSGIALGFIFEDEYTHADNAIPWLFMGVASFLIPPLVFIIVGIAAAVVIGIFYLIITVIACVFLIACCGNSC